MLKAAGSASTGGVASSSPAAIEGADVEDRQGRPAGGKHPDQSLVAHRRQAQADRLRQGADGDGQLDGRAVGQGDGDVQGFAEGVTEDPGRSRFPRSQAGVEGGGVLLRWHADGALDGGISRLGEPHQIFAGGSSAK